MAPVVEPISKKKKVVFVAITVVLVLAIVELIVSFVLNGNSRILESEKRKAMGAYKNKPWAEQLFEDGPRCLEQTYKKNPYPRTYVRYLNHDIYFDCETQTQTYINGVRKSWNPDLNALPPGTPTSSVAVFGGSTLLGIETPDDMTIPSYFSKLINSKNDTRAFVITNYGVSSYTYTQALVKLILLLREGKRFDYVVMYGGTNDIDNAYEAGEAGALVAENILRLKVEKRPFFERVRSFFHLLVQNCSTCKLLYVVSRNTPILKDYVSPTLSRARNYVDLKRGQQADAQEIERLAQDIAEYYKKSHDLLDALSKTYNFRYIEFWQPALFYDDKLVAGEEHLENSRASDEKLKTLYRLTREYLKNMRLENFYDISDVLNNRQEAAYIDPVHVGAEAHETIAKKIHETFAEKFLQESAAKN